MLARAARRKQRRQTSQVLAASFAQLQLPFLAPAQLRWSATHPVAASTRLPNARISKTPQASLAAWQLRSLATTADISTPREPASLPPGGFRNASQEDHVTWDYARTLPSTTMSNLRPYSDPIVINTSTLTPITTQYIRHGIGGTSADLLQHLHTSLRVGRLARAEAIIHRLAGQTQPNSAAMLYAHTAYLEELLKDLAGHIRGSDRKSTSLKDMQRWFDVEIKGKGTNPDTRLLVIMIRASIRALEGVQRDRSIQRYANMAKELDDEACDEVMYSDEYDDMEFTILGKATSEFYETGLPPPEGADIAIGQPQSAEAEAQVGRPVATPQPSAEEDLPEIRTVEQKGLGLESIKEQLRVYRDSTRPAQNVSEKERYERAYERQLLMEETAVETAVERWRKEDEQLRSIGIQTFMQSKPIGALMWQWYSTLLPALNKEMKAVKRAFEPDGCKTDDRVQYGPYLELLPLEKVAAHAILFVMAMTNQGKDRSTKEYNQGVKISTLALGLGRMIEEEALVYSNSGKTKGKSKRVKAKSRRHQRQLLANVRKRLQAQHTASGGVTPRESLPPFSWPTNIKLKLGAMLISKLIETAQLPVTREHPRTREKITQMQPAFLHKVRYLRGKKSGLITPNAALVNKIQVQPVGSLIAKRLPMVVEPKPWTSFGTGGYLQYSTPAVRLKVGDRSGKDYIVAAEHKGDMNQIFAGLNVLGRTPWRVNGDVFRVQLEAWNSGDAIANFAPVDPKLEIPPEPEPSSPQHERKYWLAAVKDAENKRAGLHSKRCFQNFQLEIARTFIDETIYFPHNIDFRGRAYPIPPYFNHMGADNARGLLVFAEGRQLGEGGLSWLKIHLANVAGYDKASLKEREEYVMQHLDEIYDSVKNPLGGGRWWLQSEDAWQTLAACFELTRALDSGDPTTYVSYLPIHQDGTCNGLQHYAALGGDKVGAAQVNLEPGDRPADVYTTVAEVVKSEIKKEAEEGNAVAQLLHGHVKRNVVKRPVMTNVYGVTYYGAKDQVLRELIEIFPDVQRHDPVNHRMMASYVARKIFKALGSMFTGAQRIQHWLGVCADRISTCVTPEQIRGLTQPAGANVEGEGKPATPSNRWKPQSIKLGEKFTGIEIEDTLATPPSGNENSNRILLRISKPLFKSTVIWTTPLRLPVVQPYRTSKSRRIVTGLQYIALQEPQVWDPVTRRKQLQAFPPNFIHSLDATHMMLSALKCAEVGMTFASIHDSFWTHACDVSALGTVLRDAFVAMHSDDIVGRLKEEFEARYKGCMYLAVVDTRSEAGQKVTEVRKRMKGESNLRQAGELAVEAERLRLCTSEDPEERAKGEGMETPGSVVEQADDKDLEIPREVLSTTLGMIPDSAQTSEETARSAAAAATGAAAQEKVEDADQDPLGDDEGIVSGSVLDTDVDALADTSASTVQGSAPSVAEQQKKAAKKLPRRKLYVWLPLRFPDVPEKGGFDVTRLRGSKYFFH